MAAEDEDCRVRLLISGGVQGVGFRYGMLLQAEERRIRGSVRNLPDGRVEAVAEGPLEALRGLIAWCRQGPRLARVFDVAVEWESPRSEPPGFVVR